MRKADSQRDRRRRRDPPPAEVHGLNERTCLTQKPIVRQGEKVVRGQVIADGAATKGGELALGKNITVSFMPWDGYNFEDAIIVSEKLIKEDKYTSIHIEEFEIEIRETKLGREEFTRDIPNVSEKALKNLAEDGVVRIGTRVHPGDILVGKIAPKSKSELTPEEKLLHAIFGRAGEDVKNDSLEVPSGVEGIVIDTERFSRKVTHRRRSAGGEHRRRSSRRRRWWSSNPTSVRKPGIAEGRPARAAKASRGVLRHPRVLQAPRPLNIEPQERGAQRRCATSSRNRFTRTRRTG